MSNLRGQARVDSPRQQAVAATFIFVLALVMLCSLPAVSQEEQALTPEEEGLVEAPKAKADIVYVRPGVDWTKYKTFYVHPLTVTPEAKDATPDSLSRRSHLGESYVLEEEDVAALCKLYMEITRKELERKGAFKVVDQPQEDTMIVVAMIVDIYLTAPIERTRRGSARDKIYTEYGGSLTVSAALADGETGKVLARVFDRQYPHRMWRRNTRISNTADARQIFQSWARQLRSRLDDIQSGKIEMP
jgi:hypothetical protein